MANSLITVNLKTYHYDVKRKIESVGTVEVFVCTSVGSYCSNCFARPDISGKMEEISVAKVNDLAAIVEKKSEENVVKEPADTAKNKVIVVGYRAEKKDSVLTSGEKKVALSVREVSGEKNL
jgi:hypothetical protein